ncbi:substrate-binding domain-containing protein [Candidatus Bipolaricaulota bacterium]|nr:substrate-binding domain-containing protein [Candidatus Bipolaricaulota bacterium]
MSLTKVLELGRAKIVLASFLMVALVLGGFAATAVGADVTESDVVDYLKSEIGSWEKAEPILSKADISVPAGFPLSEPEEEFNIPLVCHGGEGNPFWNTVEYGYRMAKEIFPVKGTMYRPSTEFEPRWQQNILVELSAQKDVDMVATTLPHETMFDEVVQDLEDSGKTVIAVNSDVEDVTQNARSAYIGQEGYDAAYQMAKAVWEKYYHETMGYDPDPKTIKILMPEGAPGAGWCQERIRGFKDFLEEMGVDTNKQVYEYKTEMSPTGQKPNAMSAIQSHPDATLVLATQTCGGTYLAMKELGMEPGEIVVVGHDLIEKLVEGIDEGYIQATVDQQPFLQGFYPVVEGYFHKMFNMTVYDIYTGGKQISKEDVKIALEFPKIIG